MNFRQYFDETNCLLFHWNVKSVTETALIIPKWHPTFVFMVSRWINSCLWGDNQLRTKTFMDMNIFQYLRRQKQPKLKETSRVYHLKLTKLL